MKCPQCTNTLPNAAMRCPYCAYTINISSTQDKPKQDKYGATVKELHPDWNKYDLREKYLYRYMAYNNTPINPQNSYQQTTTYIEDINKHSSPQKAILIISLVFVFLILISFISVAIIDIELLDFFLYSFPSMFFFYGICIGLYYYGVKTTSFTGGCRHSGRVYQPDHS